MMGLTVRGVTLCAFMAMGLVGGAAADEATTAKRQCVANTTQAAAAQGGAPDATAQIQMIAVGLCDCVIEKFQAMGDDGAKLVHVMAKITSEQAQSGNADPAVDKANITAILVADYGMSQADAEGFYDRVNPEANKIGKQCTEDAMQKTTTPMTPSK